MRISYEKLNEINQLCQDRDEEAFVLGANCLLEALGETAKLTLGDADIAKGLIHTTAFEFLDREDYAAAATLMFGFEYFDARPQNVQDIFRLCTTSDKVVSFGASSMSKSFAIGIWLVCDFLRDPLYTRILLGSVGERHLKENLFSGMINAIQNSIVDLEVDASTSGMKIVPKGVDTMDSGIFGKAFPNDSNHSTGRLRGVKPKKRSGPPHPKFGKMGRVRVMLDEASTVPRGAYMDFGSAMASSDGKGRVKFFVAFNPTIVEHWTREISEPVGGVTEIDPDTGIEWTSARGWHVYRLDGMRSPNVLARKEICPGMMTWEAMQDKISAGEGSEDYWVYGRGLWMRKGHFSCVVPMDYLTGARGEFMFPEGSQALASLDVAFSGDKVIYTLGRWGIADSYLTQNSEKVKFDSPRWALQVDQQLQIDIPASDTTKLAAEVIRISKDFLVPPEWFSLDRTAIGKGIYDVLTTQWGPVLGINWQGAASERKILSTDDRLAKDEYHNITSEMWFATREWLQHGFMKISMSVKSDPLFQQLSTRRYKHNRAKVQVESKLDYRVRTAGNASPDEADSLIMLPLLCRMRGDFLPELMNTGTRSLVEYDPMRLFESRTSDSGDILMSREEKAVHKGLSAALRDARRFA